MLRIVAVGTLVIASFFSSVAHADLQPRRQRVSCTPDFGNGEAAIAVIDEKAGTFAKDIKDFFVADQRFRVTLTLTAGGDPIKAKLVITTTQKDEGSGEYMLSHDGGLIAEVKKEFDFSDSEISAYAHTIRSSMSGLSKFVVICEKDAVRLVPVANP